jgi:hypothetical protein
MAARTQAKTRMFLLATVQPSADGHTCIVPATTAPIGPLCWEAGPFALRLRRGPCAARWEVVNWGCCWCPPVLSCRGISGPCRSGGIGRRAGLKSRFPQGSVGSTPTFGKYARTPSDHLHCGSRASAQESASDVQSCTTRWTSSQRLRFGCSEVIRQTVSWVRRLRHGPCDNGEQAPVHRPSTRCRPSTIPGADGPASAAHRRLTTDPALPWASATDAAAMFCSWTTIATSVRP